MADTIFTHDAGTVSFDSVSTEGVTTDDDGTTTFTWDEIPVVQLDEPPHAQAFDTDEFYKIEGATVARPIKQPYRNGDSIEWYKKPAAELRQMAWSLDNAPYTLEHPDTGMVKDVNDIHGFWKQPRYDSDTERLKEDLYVPTNDEEAKQFISKYQDVSVGFYNRLSSEYDGDTGDLTDDDVDGFQTSMYGDHIAGVKQGRCSGDDGCGLDGSDNTGQVVMKTDSMVPSEDEENMDDNCNCGDNNMTDKDDNPDFDIPDLSTDSLADKHDGVRDIREERDSLKSTVDEVEEELEDHGIELDDYDCPCEAIHDLAESRDEAEDELEDLRSEVDEYREEERQERLDELGEYMDDTEEYQDASLEELEEEIDRMEKLTEKFNFDVKNIEGSQDSKDSKSTGKRTVGRGHASGR